jgi:2',3'-cyclic-nucleotide 2'-phosphodiesterase (5'-nucleotidase family)
MLKAFWVGKRRPGRHSGRAALHLFKLVLLNGMAQLLLCHPVLAERHVSILMTSNIQGQFSLNLDDSQESDPVLALARSILAEKDRGIDIVLDLGNAFYPGALSKFSSGSIMMDFLDYFAFDATLVSSQDLHIGVKNLEFLKQNKSVQLLSANIVRQDSPVFLPWFAVDVRGLRLAFVGISSNSILFDIAEKDLYNIALKDAKQSLDLALQQIQATGVKHIVLMSGLNLSETMDLIESFPGIGLALCGGDNTGELYAGKASRIDLADGRSIIIAAGMADYTILDLAVDNRISLRHLGEHRTMAQTTTDDRYLVFKDRLSLWKKKYLEEENRKIAAAGAEPHIIDDLRLSRLLQDRFNAEIAMVQKDTLAPLPLQHDIRRSDLLKIVNLDYPVFTFRLTGNELRAVAQQADGLVVSGISGQEDVTVQGYAVHADQRYKVAATQPAFEKIQRVLGRSVPYSNTWLGVKDLLFEDMQTRQVLMVPDYDYLDRRFRFNIDAYLSNIIDNSDVDRGSQIATPIGQPEQSYTKWGLENIIDFAVYNKYHRFVLTPYMLYVRQDDYYLNNLLRGTLLYEYNLNPIFRPYNKVQYETVVADVDHRRPSLVRETVGVSAFYTYIEGKLGLGFEKKVQDPVDDPVYGLEFIINARYPIFDNLIYTLNLDTFAVVNSEFNDLWEIRSSIENVLSVPLNTHLSISLRHRYFYRYEGEIGQDYRNSQFITAFDLKAGWKIW